MIRPPSEMDGPHICESLEALFAPAHEPEPDEIDFSRIPLEHPRVLRERAANRFRNGRSLMKAQLRHVLDPLELHIWFASDRFHSLGDVKGRLDTYLWTTPSSRRFVKTSRLHLEDLEVDRKDSFLVRVVRHGVPRNGSGKRFELASFTFRVPKEPPMLFEREPLGDPLDGGTINWKFNIATPMHLTALMQRVRRCQVVFNGNPLDLDGFFFQGQVHRIDDKTQKLTRR